MHIRDATDYSIGELFKENTGSSERFQVPPYQRRYSWEKDQWNDLWEDLTALETPQDKHFLGTIVFISGAHKAQGNNLIDVVDGQQRITTISLLLAAMRDHYKEADEDYTGYVEGLDKRLWMYGYDGNKTDKLKLELGNLDKKDYFNIIAGKENEVENDKLLDAYKFYRKKLRNQDTDDIVTLQHHLLENFRYVSVTVEEDGDAYRLFEVLNNRGLELSPVDLIKNHLFYISFEQDAIDQKRIKTLWTQTIHNLDGINEVRFFRQYMMSSQIADIGEKVTKNKLFDHFTDSLDDIEDVEAFLEDIRDKSKLYRKLYFAEIDQFDKNQNEIINRKLKDAKVVSKTIFTALMGIFDELERPQTISKAIDILLVMLIRRSITGQSTASLDIWMGHLSKNGFDEDYPSYVEEYIKDEIPDDSTFKEHFAEGKYRNNDLTRYLLVTIEEEHYGQQGKRVATPYEVHIEHILPETISKKTSNWLEYADIDEEEHKTYRKKIGNLTLLERSPNIKASNNPYEEKRRHYAPEKTEMEMTQRIPTQYSQWKTDQIEKRSKQLAEIAVEVWSL